MRFLPLAYFPNSYFWGTGQATGTAGSMAAALSGRGALGGAIQAEASLAVEFEGVGVFQGNLAFDSRQAIIGGGGFAGHWRRRKDPVQHLLADLAMQAGGTGTLSGCLVATSRPSAAFAAHSKMQGRLVASVAIRADAVGAGKLSAVPVVDITRLLQRRREEEIVAWLLVG